MIIRKMELRDLPQVVRIEESLFSDPWTENAFRDTLDQKEADFVVAVSEQEEIIGYCGAYRALDEAEIVNVAIRKKDQNQGVGAGMVRTLIEEERKRVFTFLFLKCEKAIYRHSTVMRNLDLKASVSAKIFMIARGKMP